MQSCWCASGKCSEHVAPVVQLTSLDQRSIASSLPACSTTFGKRVRCATLRNASVSAAASSFLPAAVRFWPEHA